VQSSSWPDCATAARRPSVLGHVQHASDVQVRVVRVRIPRVALCPWRMSEAPVPGRFTMRSIMLQSVFASGRARGTTARLGSGTEALARSLISRSQDLSTPGDILRSNHAGAPPRHQQPGRDHDAPGWHHRQPSSVEGVWDYIQRRDSPSQGQPQHRSTAMQHLAVLSASSAVPLSSTLSTMTEPPLSFRGVLGTRAAPRSSDYLTQDPNVTLLTVCICDELVVCFTEPSLGGNTTLKCLCPSTLTMRL